MGVGPALEGKGTLGRLATDRCCRWNAKERQTRVAKHREV
jgi:hypothetical protein